MPVALSALHEAGKLKFWKLALDGRPVAMLFAVLDGDQAWLGKIAHDPGFSRFSPGVLMILDATEGLFADGTIRRADSCAIPGHPMINHLWRGRIAVADVMMAAPAVSAFSFTAARTTETLLRRARATARDLFNTMTGRHRR